ncbi:MAG: sugar transferase [Chloroflexia bacterium]
MSHTAETAPFPRVKATTEARLARLARVGLVWLDALALATAFLLAGLLRFYLPWWPYYHTFSPAFYLRLGLTMLPGWILLFASFRLYDPEELLGGVQEYIGLINACTIGTLAIVAYDFLSRGEEETVSRAWLLLVWALSILIAGGTRFALRRVVYALRRRGYFLRPALVIGANAEGQAVARQLQEAPSASGVRVLGLVDDTPPKETSGLPHLGGLSDLPRLIGEHHVRELIVAGTTLPREQLLDLFFRYNQGDNHLTIRLSSGLFEVLTTGMRLRKVGYVPLVTLERTRITGVDALLKRGLDLAGSLGLLLLSAPLLLLIALLVKTTSPGPIFYRRRVLGQGGRTFDALKFRTMYTNGPEILARYPELQEELRRQGKIKNDPRITPLGRILRRLSLDELPQLFNILVGQMSLVGPRMISPEEWPYYGKWQHNLLTVKPGLTGLWQVSGRSDLSYEDRVRLDMHYIRDYTIWLDLQILLQTLPVVLRGKGAY